MFQDLGTGNGALFGNMANQDNRNAGRFGKAQQLRRHFLDLAHRPRRTLYRGAVHGLHGVYDHEVRGHFLGLGQDGAHVGFAVDEAIGGVPAQAVGPHFHLLDAFLTGDIQSL